MKFDKKIAVLCFSLLGLTQLSHAQTIFDREEISVVQERIYDRKHEINISAGYIPDDDYYESYAGALSYTYNFSDYFSWEVVKAQYFYNDEKELKSHLENDFQVTPETFDHLAYMAHSSLVVKPSYGKDAVFNSFIVNHETYYLLGVGLAKYERDYSFEEATDESVLSVAVGAGRRFFLSKSFAVTFDIKSYTNFKEEAPETNVYMAMGLSFRFDFSDSDSVVRDKISDVYGYMNHDKN